MEYGKLAKQHCRVILPLKVLQSAAGWYIGTFGTDDMELSGPVSRESAEYFSTKAKAQMALDSGGWTQRDSP